MPITYDKWPRHVNRLRFSRVWPSKLWPHWRWKSRPKAGRPVVDREARMLICRLSRQIPTWGASRIQAELRLLGNDLAESTVAKYAVRHPKPPSQSWRMFPTNHANQIVACGFFTAPTVTFRQTSRTETTRKARECSAKPEPGFIVNDVTTARQRMLTRAGRSRAERRRRSLDTT